MPRTLRQGILLLSIGSKVSLLKIAALSAQRRGLLLHATDRHRDVPARPFADRFVVFEQSDPEHWVQWLESYCFEKQIGLVIPTRHSDLLLLASAKERLLSNGTYAAVSSTDAVDLANDKFRMYRHLIDKGYPTPRTYLASRDAPNAEDYPLFAKPRYGAASQGVHRVETAQQAATLGEDWVLQPTVGGEEFTTNVYVNLHGQCLAAIPHRRIVVANGEAVQAMTTESSVLQDLARGVAESIPGLFGPINLQAFLDGSTKTASITDINPRLGGAFPLCHQAKGTFIEWLCVELLDKEKIEPTAHWTRNLLMMRYRSEIFELATDPMGRA